MKLGQLYSSIVEGKFSSLRGDINGLLDDLASRTIIAFTIKTTGIDPNQPFAQILRISAIAIDPETGQELDSYDQEASLNLGTLREMDIQNRMKGDEQWPVDQPSIADMLNASDYDLEDRSDRVDEMVVVMGFKDFVDKYRHAVLVTYNAQYCMHYLNATLPDPVSGTPVLGLSQFTRIYFEPVLQAMMMRGNSRAARMAEKLWSKGKSNVSITELARALGVKKFPWRSDSDVVQLAAIFAGILRFLQKNRGMFVDRNFHTIAGHVAQKQHNSDE